MTSVTLNCLVVGDDPYEKTFPVDIDINKNIGALKKAIKNDIGGSVSVRDLKLFKVNILLGSTRDENVVAILKTGDLSVGLEMNNNLEKISVHFSTQPADTNLHILVQLPTVAIDQPVTEIDLRRRISELEYRLMAGKAGTEDSVYIFIDNSNIYIEGKKKVSMLENVNQHLVQIDYGKLVETVQDNRRVGASPVVVGSIPPPEDTIWAMIRKLGYSVTVFERNCINREKEVDSELSLRINDTIHYYVPGTVILIAGDGDYGPAFRRVLDAKWTIEIWFWTHVSSRITEMGNKYPDYKPAIASRTTILNLEHYYKKFMYAHGYNGTVGIKYLEIFTDLVEDSDIMECYVDLDLFGWWYSQENLNNSNTLKLYVNTYSQWKELKDLIMRKYPNSKEVHRDAFFLEKDTFFKMYLSFLKHKVNST